MRQSTVHTLVICKFLAAASKDTIPCSVTGETILIETTKDELTNFCNYFGYVYVNKIGSNIVRVAEKQSLNLVCEINTDDMSVKYISPAVEKALDKPKKRHYTRVEAEDEETTYTHSEANFTA